MIDDPIRVGPGPGCTYCGEGYGKHKSDCPRADKPQPPRSIRSERARFWAFRINQCQDSMAACLVMSEFLRELGITVEVAARNGDGHA